MRITVERSGDRIHRDNPTQSYLLDVPNPNHQTMTVPSTLGAYSGSSSKCHNLQREPQPVQYPDRGS